MKDREFEEHMRTMFAPQPLLTERERWWLSALAHALFTAVLWGGCYAIAESTGWLGQLNGVDIGTVALVAVMLGRWTERRARSASSSPDDAS